MASGSPAVSLHSIYQQVPEIFLRCDRAEATKAQVALPFNKVLEQFTNFQVRADQERSDAVPQVETPFLKVTTRRQLTISATPVAPVPIVRESADAVRSRRTFRLDRSLMPVRLPLPDQAEEQRRFDGMAPRMPSRSSTPCCAYIRASKISPNGTGVPAPERVPASSGPSVPTFSPRRLPPPPARIPFKMSPPSNDLRKSRPWLTAETFAVTPAPRLQFPADGPRP